MLFRLRSEKTRDFFAGTWIAADGTAQALGSDDIALTPLSESTVAGRQISTHWKVKAKSRGLDIETTPLNADSWMATAVPAIGKAPSASWGSHQGQGYLEMTGYRRAPTYKLTRNTVMTAQHVMRQLIRRPDVSSQEPRGQRLPVLRLGSSGYRLAQSNAGTASPVLLNKDDARCF